MSEQRHALYVAWGFPPAKSGGVFRMMETANVLVDQGWQVTVIACDIDDLRRYAGVDLSTLDGVDPRVRVVRVPMELGPFETDLYRWDEARVEDPAGWRTAYRRRVDEGFPNSVYSLWEAPLLEAARRVHAEHPVDLVLASGGPFVCFAAGRALRVEHGVPYVLDYRDSWSLQQFTDERLHGPGSRVHEVEQQLLSDAAEVWFVNEAMRTWHEEVYPRLVGKTRVVTNGYDEAALQGVSPPHPHDGPVRFGYLGTMTTAVPLREALEGYRVAGRLDEAVADSTFEVVGYLGFYPTPNERLRQRILEYAPDGVWWSGALPKTEVGTAYERMDALVLTFGGTRYVTSGKVFEYMATGRPIVSVHAPENAVKDVLEGYPLWFRSASLESADVATAFVEAARAVRSGQAQRPEVVSAALEHARRFERRTCLRPAIRDLPRLADLIRGTSVPAAADTDVVAWVGPGEPDGLRSWVTRCGRRLVVVDEGGFEGATAMPTPDATGSVSAEPGTLAGRLHRMYALVAHEDDRTEATEAVISTAVRVLESGAGVVLARSSVGERAARLCRQVVPGLVAEVVPGPVICDEDAVALFAALPPARLRAAQTPVSLETDDEGRGRSAGGAPDGSDVPDGSDAPDGTDAPDDGSDALTEVGAPRLGRRRLGTGRLASRRSRSAPDGAS